MGVKNHQQKQIQVSHWWKQSTANQHPRKWQDEKNRLKKSPAPRKQTWHRKIPMFNRKYIFNGGFSIVMLVFEGVMLQARHPELPKPIQFLGSSPLVFWDYWTPLWKLRWLAEKSQVFHDIHRLKWLEFFHCHSLVFGTLTLGVVVFSFFLFFEPSSGPQFFSLARLGCLTYSWWCRNLACTTCYLWKKPYEKWGCSPGIKLVIAGFLNHQEYHKALLASCPP